MLPLAPQILLYPISLYVQLLKRHDNRTHASFSLQIGVREAIKVERYRLATNFLPRTLVNASSDSALKLRAKF